MHKSVTIQDVYEALKRVEEKMVTREDIEALVDSVEILSNPKTMEALRKSDRDIKACRVKEVTSVDLLTFQYVFSHSASTSTSTSESC
jgi:antitoxin YefM